MVIKTLLRHTQEGYLVEIDLGSSQLPGSWSNWLKLDSLLGFLTGRTCEIPGSGFSL